MIREREPLLKKLQVALEKIREKGVRTEEIAVGLNVSNGTIWSWIAGRRCPGYSTIKDLENLYKIKIL